MRKIMFSGLIIFLVFFIGATVCWFTFEKQNYEETKINKSYPKSNFKNISINTEYANVKVIRGPKFKVKYNGDNKVNLYKKNKTLKISEVKNVDRGYAINLNPFRKDDNQIVIEVPNKKLSELKGYSQNSSYYIKNINSKNMNLINSSNPIILNSVNVENSDVKSNATHFNINNSILKNANFNLEKGFIVVNKSDISNSIFLLGNGNISFNKMSPRNDIKASTKKGDIHYTYKDKPENTLLKLQPGKGKSIIENKYFHESKVGKSDNILEFYTVDGDIVIK
ncbi:MULTISPECIES: DUF4097 family beta strand repeat-containing protein [Staphylococcus]|uniref:DUF4097 family beta strand repeat-containing protein n=1 Tax=Staphylococcus TaxID=1279 RepID=UPI0002463C3F|nr:MULTISPECIES: DUF4097 family beta strand repeat-containing protein [Staphylococcus]MCR4456008.1 DUF4097 domain-containing protein [Aeromonas salmonicida]AGZ24752.1 hypothetical protein STP1_0441 [Staphylococcus pasteuri SP1]KAB7644003.1 DUF4097 domain-containing protein [Staphylococcus sp. B2-b]MBN6853811.1 DUF4097 family beta strand repeat protein [Staphylococcus warneri]MBT2770316.1 DUF4097 family beta strand repeat protein [Staphylococcus warneri]